MVMGMGIILRQCMLAFYFSPRARQTLLTAAPSALLCQSRFGGHFSSEPSRTSEVRESGLFSTLGSGGVRGLIYIYIYIYTHIYIYR